MIITRWTDKEFFNLYTMEFHSAIKKLKSKHVQKMDGNFYVKQNKRLKEDICNFFIIWES